MVEKWSYFLDRFLEGLGDGFGRLLGRILEVRGDFWEVKWEKKGNKNEESKKKAKRSRKKSETGLVRRRPRWPLRLKSLSRRGPGEGRRSKFFKIQTRPSEPGARGRIVAAERSHRPRAHSRWPNLSWIWKCLMMFFHKLLYLGMYYILGYIGICKGLFQFWLHL